MAYINDPLVDNSSAISSHPLTRTTYLRGDDKRFAWRELMVHLGSEETLRELLKDGWVIDARKA